MGVVLIVGTAKGAAIVRSDPGRTRWSCDGLQTKGWIATAATRDAQGRYYMGVTHDVYGAVIVTSEDLVTWTQLENGPRYKPGDRGNPEHNRIIGATDFSGRLKSGGRFVDQIWKLHAVGDALYAGVSEAGLFRSDDRGKSWEPVPGLNDDPGRENWQPGFGGLCLHSVLVDERNPQRIWVGISSEGCFRSDDGGRTWASKNEGVNRQEGWCVHSLAHDPKNADVIYRQDHRGVYVTLDGGDSWQLRENGLPIANLSDGHRCVFGFPIAMDPGSQTAWVAPLEGDNFRYPHDGKLRVYRTRDQGESWQTLSNGLPDDMWAGVLRGGMAIDRLDPCGVYFGTTSGHVFASADAGESWTQVPGTLPKVFCVEAFEV